MRTLERRLRRHKNYMDQDRVASQRTEAQKVQIASTWTTLRASSLFLSLYAGLCFFSHLTFHSVIAQASRNLIMQFGGSYPQEITNFSWAVESTYTTSTGLLWGLAGGIVLFFVCYIFINSALTGYGPTEAFTRYFVKVLRLESLRTDPAYSRDIVAGLEVLLSYVLVYYLITLTTNPYLSTNINDIVDALSFAGILGASTFLLVFFRRKNRLRKDFIEKEGVQLKIFEIEAQWTRQLWLLLGTGLVLLTAAILSPTLVSFSSSSIPRPILSADNYRLILLGLGMIDLVLFLGYFFGIWVQVLWQESDIIESMKIYGKLRSSSV